ncbi:hypothetical protein [Amycolatopsis sp. CA-230715]|uniref:hypothetical protein n=1 Tax=Amycolatopsis sp. CA-230715 TaxID=2745196 RepID=UPI001C00E2DC|nr:hypothetical protein [Amycolatopsis sp. CA-230715]
MRNRARRIVLLSTGDLLDDVTQQPDAIAQVHGAFEHAVATIFPTLRDLHEVCGEALNALATPPNRPPRHRPAPPNLDLLTDRIDKICENLIGSAIPSADIPTPFDDAALPAIGIGDVLVRDIEETARTQVGAPITPLVNDTITREMIQPAFVVLEGVMTESDVAAYLSNEVDELTVLEPTITPGQVRVHFIRLALLTFQVTYNVIDGSIDLVRLALVEYVPDVLDALPFFEVPGAADDGSVPE